MAAKMEAKTRILARIGDDDFGHEMLANFKRQGVNTGQYPQLVAPIWLDCLLTLSTSGDRFSNCR